MLRITPEELARWSQLIYEYTGIVVGADKAYLIESRLADLARDHDCVSFGQLYDLCRREPRGELAERIIDRIATQETSFFRDPKVFEALTRLLKETIIPRRREAAAGYPPTLRIWSAACSTGQEPYSVAMLLAELIPDLDHWGLTMIATDISNQAFAKARSGRYTEMEVGRGLEPRLRQKYFRQFSDGTWEIVPSLRNKVHFRKINLLRDDFASLGGFDLILCRNVAIYFDQATKKRLFEKIGEVLNPHGYLMVGATESLSMTLALYRTVNIERCNFYTKEPAQGHLGSPGLPEG